MDTKHVSIILSIESLDSAVANIYKIPGESKLFAVYYFAPRSARRTSKLLSNGVKDLTLQGLETLRIFALISKRSDKIAHSNY